ncbi:MAG: DNA ligase D [Acidobacteriota bacterium]
MSTHKSVPWRDDPGKVRPMLASLGDAALDDALFAFEPKYDGIRALVSLDPKAGSRRVAIYSRLGHEKSLQFPDLVRAFDARVRALRRPLLLDGEIVALDGAGHPTSLTKLQSRLHVTGRHLAASRSTEQPAAFVAFDLLREGGEDLRDLPLSARRDRLERAWSDAGSPLLRISQFEPGDGRALMRRAHDEGWEGLVAKHLDSRYRSGKRTADWRKIKLTQRQEFVVCGWTAPRGSRHAFGALLLGVRKGELLVFAGSVGTGFDASELARVSGLLRPLVRKACPFAEPPDTAERATWVEPLLVADVRFAEWTPEGHLRHPVYLGLRDDVRPRAVVRERPSLEPADDAPGPGPGAAPDPETGLRAAVVEQLHDIEAGRGSGVIVLPDGSSLEVTNLGKVFWPAGRLTKGALMRYYAGAAPVILPVVAERPLVMKRFPNGIAGKTFYQQRAPDQVPEGVRVETVEGDTDVPSRLVGGSLRTLIYMSQLAVISQDPWFSRVATSDNPDFIAFDLDPMPGVSFRQVLDVARWLRDELGRLGIAGAAKTSGASGLHLFVKLPPSLPYQAGQIFAQIVATMVAQRHPSQATVERAVGARGRTVYVDYLQNIRGKTLACAYSARASEFAGVSAPLTWREVDDGVDPRDFTIESMPSRLRTAGDVWAEGLRGAPADLGAVLRYAEPGSGEKAEVRSQESGDRRQETEDRIG